jgi:hypothetical protein
MVHSAGFSHRNSASIESNTEESGMFADRNYSNGPNRRELKRLFAEYDRAYNEPSIQAHAAQDAELNIPTVDAADTSPFERQLTYAAQSLASGVGGRYRDPLEVLDAKIKAEEDFVQRKHKTALEKIDSIYSAEKDAADDAYGLQAAHTRLESTEKLYAAICTRYGRCPAQYIPHWLYVTLALAIFLGEIPLNALVFQIFGENQVMTWVMAFVIGLSVPITAHFIGIKIREHGDGFSWANAIKALVATALVVSALYGISVLRQVYLGEFKDALGLTDNLVQSTGLFFLLNIAVLGAAIMVAYLSHDPVPGFERAAQEYQVALKAVERREARRVVRLKAAAVDRAHALDDTHRGLRDGMNTVSMMKGQYDQLLKEGQELERRCLHRLMQHAQMYRLENVRKRLDRAHPVSFNKELTFPLVLESMKEKLLND